MPATVWQIIMTFKYNPLTNQLDYTSVGGGGVGSWNLIGTQTISSPLANVNFNNLSTTFQEFCLVFNSISTSASDLLLVKFSADNGTTFLNCSYQLNENSSSMFNYNDYILYTSNISSNQKSGSANVSNTSSSVCLIGSDTNLGSNGGVASGILSTSNPIIFISLQAAGGSNLTGGAVILYGK
jgi:hypothetical protein